MISINTEVVHAPMHVRPERPGDADAIRDVITAAFASAPYSSGTEAAIVDALRAAEALTISLVAEAGDEIAGHVAFSPVAIEGRASRWFGLGPVAVRPDRQRRGIGHALIRTGLDGLRRLGASGCVVVGDPAYYSRFGFGSDPGLTYAGVDPAYFQRLNFGGEAPAGTVTYHQAFEAG